MATGRRGRGSALEAEPTFAEAQSWWSKMQRPVTFTGVPGHPLQATVLWNAGLLFCSNPREYPAGRPRIGSAWRLAPGLSVEMDGYELDALQMEFSFGKGFHLPDRLDNTKGEVSQELLEGRMPVVVSRLKHDGIEWTETVFSHVTATAGIPLEEDLEVQARRLRSQVMQARRLRSLLTEVLWTAHNPSGKARAAQMSCHLTAPHILLGYKIKMEEKAAAYLRHLAWRNPLLLDDRGRARLACRPLGGLAAVAEGEGEVGFVGAVAGEEAARLSDLGLAQDVLQFRSQVPAGGTVSFRMVVPFYAADPGVLQKALATRFEGALAKTRKAWQGVFASARIETPEKIVNESFDAYLYHAMVATGRRVSSGDWILKCSPNNYEAMWSAQSAIAAYSMDLRGQHELSRQVLETFLDHQGPLPGHVLKLFGDKQVAESEGFSAHPGFLGNIEGMMAIIWAFYHGWIMWAIGQHARLTGDWGWFRGHADALALACEWIEAQRKRTRLRDAKGAKVLSYGLLPAANAFDWGFGHMFWSDAHTYRGVREIGECLKRVGHGKADRFLAQAEDYRNDIVSAVTRSRDASPRVPLDDGGSLPFVPMSVEMRDYFAPDWTYVACGALNLAWAGVVPADHELMNQVLAFLEAGRPLGKWDGEKEKYQGWDWPARTPADEDFLEVTRPKSGRCYLWRHKMTYEPGWIPQAFAFMSRDEMPALLEHFYSLISNGGQHVSLRTPIEQRDGVAWTQCGDANLMWLMRNMLVREEGSKLILAGSCPRAWLAGGKSVGVQELPTHFGAVSYRLDSQQGGKRIAGRFRFGFRGKPKTILLRLRHPQGLLPRRVTVNGKPAVANGEWIELPAACRTMAAVY